MFRVWRWLPLAVALAALTTGLPVPDETVDTSTKLLGSSVVTSVSVVIGNEDGTSEKPDERKAAEDLPPSTVDMLKPDGFQFYTVDEKGQLVTRQMTDAEIQSIIAAGGGPFPTETQGPQKTGDNTSGDTKVADVVQNVQNVLKAELSKPPMAIGSVPTIPGHANDEWSSILPSILGGDAESAPVTLTKDVIKENVAPVESPEEPPAPGSPEPKPEEAGSPTKGETGTEEMVKAGEIQKVESTGEPVKIEEAEEASERPMIQVPVITADSVQPTTKGPSLDEEKPVYQILNTISAEEVKDKEGEEEPEKSVAGAGPEEESSGSPSATEKIENKVKEPETSPVTEKTAIEVNAPEESPSPTMETVAETEVTSSVVPSIQEGSEKPESSSGATEAEEAKPKKPSIFLEAPVVEEEPVDGGTGSDEKDKEGIQGVKPAAVDESASAPSGQTESTTSAATIEQEVLEIVNHVPESISTIVDELISETAADMSDGSTRDEVKLEDPKAPTTEDGTKAHGSGEENGDGGSSASKEPESSQTPDKGAEPVFQKLPDISPVPSDAKTTTETPAPSENVGKKPEATVSGDKVGTESQSAEMAQNSTPVVEAGGPVAAEAATAEKKPETLMSELADSVSSVISQVSEAMPSMVPIPQKSEVNEQPVKRVEDEAKIEEASTVRAEVLPSTAATASEEEAKPLVPDVETAKPEVKTPEVTTASSHLDDTKTTKISEPVSTDVLESSSAANEKLDPPGIETTSGPGAASDEEKTEQVGVKPADSAATGISEPSVELEPVAPEPEDPKPDKAEVVAKDETETEKVAEAPIVRIDISEAKPTVSDAKVDGDSTESSVVRIQLTNTVSAVNQMIDSAPEAVAPVETQAITFPEKDVLEPSKAQTVGSDLIAGAQPSDSTEVKAPESSAEPNMADSAGDQKLEVPSPAVPSGALKPEAVTSGGVEPKPDIESAKISEAEDTQATTQAKPEVIKTGIVESPTSEATTSEKSDETKLEKPEVEKEDSKDSAAPVDKVSPVAPAVKNDPPVPADEKIDSSTKTEDRERPTQSPQGVVESATIVSEESNERIEVPKPVEKPTVKDTPAEVPEETAVSATVEVRPSVTEAAEKMKEDDGVEPAKSGEKPVTDTKTKIEHEAVGDLEENIPGTKPEGDKTDDASNEPTKDLVPVEPATPAPAQPDVEPSDKVLDVSTPAPAAAQTDSEIQTTESTEKKPESGDASQAVKEASESAGKPEVVETGDAKPSTSGSDPEKKIPSTPSPAQTDVKESSASENVDKDQASVPLVRIDVSPEKSQVESSTMEVEKIPEIAEADDKKGETPATPASGESNLSEADESVKKTDKPEDGSAGSETTVGTLPSSSENPTKMEEIEVTKVELPAATKEPEVVAETSEESVKEAVNGVDSKIPEVTGSVEATSSASPIPEKIESEEAAKPGVNAPPKTQEIRIQVNDTAVLVTKQQIPQKAETDEKKDKPIETPVREVDVVEVPSQAPEKIEVSSQPPQELEVLAQPATITTKPTPMTKTTPKPTADKVKGESVPQHKKPSGDPYVKLGEKKPEEKPADPEVPKRPIPGIRKPANKDGEDKWTLIPQSEAYPAIKQQVNPSPGEPTSANKSGEASVPLEAHQSAVSLDESTRDQDEDIGNFSKLCNELAFSFWIATNKGLSTARSLALSPFGMTSMLAMVFLGARGPTSGQMNDILGLDDVVTFNPHLVFQNVTDSVNLARGQGIANAAFVRELFADRLKAGRLLAFYKERAQQFYDGHVEEVNFATISDLARRRTNLLIRRQTGGRIRDFVKGNVMPLRSPLAALSANVFQTDCAGASSEGRDGEMYFAVLPAVRQRKLVPVPATVWRSGVLAGYEPGLDATVVSLGGVGNLVSTIFVLPGQQGLAAPWDSLDLLEKRLLEGAFANGVWDRLIRVLIPRMGLEVQVPKFSHRSVVNATAALKRMGLDELFSKHADLKGINGVGNDLHLADMLQINLFSTCGDEAITGGRHHVEIYPASPLRGARGDEKTSENEEPEDEADLPEVENGERRTRRGLNVGEYVQRSHDLEKRSSSVAAEKQLIPDDNEEEERSHRSSNPSKELLQLSKGKQSERPLLKLDRPFLYFVRHNPTGMILHMGRFNPRLMP